MSFLEALQPLQPLEPGVWSPWRSLLAPPRSIGRAREDVIALLRRALHTLTNHSPALCGGGGVRGVAPTWWPGASAGSLGHRLALDRTAVA